MNEPTRAPGELDRDLNDFLSPASFWWPRYVNESAWLEHAPFAFWLVDMLRPRKVVELGTHAGYSYFSFCQAVQTLALDTQCFAVDHWLGDEHSGLYGDDVFRGVEMHNNRNYIGFSRLIRSTFDDAVSSFPDGSIDLLHLDGRHLYEDVSHDFETWRKKLSDRAVVLFHDTNVHDRDFGVFRFWAEIAEGAPAFEFHHGHGLGVLGFGENQNEAMARLFTTKQQPAQDIRQAYSRLGGAIQADVEARMQKSVVDTRPAAEQLRAASQALDIEKAEVSRLQDEVVTLTSSLEDLRRAVASNEIQSRKHSEERLRLLNGLNARFDEIAELTRLLKSRDEDMELLRAVAATLIGDSRKGQLVGLAPSPLQEWLREKQLQRRGLFDPELYLRAHPDVREKRVNALRHYLVHGLKEGRARN